MYSPSEPAAVPNPDVYEYAVDDLGIPLVEVAPAAHSQTAMISSSVETASNDT